MRDRKSSESSQALLGKMIGLLYDNLQEFPRLISQCKQMEAEQRNVPIISFTLCTNGSCSPRLTQPA